MRTDKYIEGFGERVLEAAEKTGLTRREIERRAGFTGKSQIYKYVSMHQMPSAYKLAKLAKVLNVSTDWLLGLRG